MGGCNDCFLTVRNSTTFNYFSHIFHSRKLFLHNTFVKLYIDRHYVNVIRVLTSQLWHQHCCVFNVFCLVFGNMGWKYFFFLNEFPLKNEGTLTLFMERSLAEMQLPILGRSECKRKTCCWRFCKRVSETPACQGARIFQMGRYQSLPDTLWWDSLGLSLSKECETRV